MTKNSTENLEFCALTISKKHHLENGWLELCARLKEIRDNGMYEGRWDSFEDFLKDPEMGMDKSTASRMITIHEVLIVKYNIEPNTISKVGWTKASELLPVINSKEDAEEWLETASVLSKDDLRKEVKEARGGGPGIGCKHEDTYEIVMRCCRNCDYKEVIKSKE